MSNSESLRNGNGVLLKSMLWFKIEFFILSNFYIKNPLLELIYMEGQN